MATSFISWTDFLEKLECFNEMNHYLEKAYC